VQHSTGVNGVKKSGLRNRFWVEAGAAIASGFLAVVTAIWPDWIERVFGIEPDQGSGALEWLIVALVLAISVGFALAARVEWRRAPRADAAH
jgi:hypothetical protein